MKFITRANSSPQGKQKVYFTGHSDDCKIYLPEISSQILKLCDCAVFYDEDPEHPEDIENFTADLDGMQLIVLVVTGNYIFGDTFAHNTVFTHAIERHIPVLPILIESELANDFSKKCGDLHCLMPHTADVTEISYEEKLKSFLESVLVGDEIAEKVRAAFDAYIFLSYRKKDRRYAQELMRLIHSNDFCRDIAIWYDEFLTPGENFNDAIRAAMEKSELFALAVTPNLLEDPNYVMTEEYPAARDLGKKILTAEILETDKNELNRRYENIPEPIDPTNSTVMSEKLASLLENIAKRENDNDPRHNFLIGLAYLSGIDVEVDQKRAVSLITSAAEAELPEALEKFASMYWMGEGVKRDHEKAIEYQKKLVSLYEKKFEAEQSEENGYILLGEIDRLGNFVYEIGHISETEEIRQKLVALCVEFNNKWNKCWSFEYSIKCYYDLGDIFQDQGRLSEAQNYYEQALEIALALDKQVHTSESQRGIYACFLRLSRICETRGELSKGAEYGKKALLAAMHLVEQVDTPRSFYDLAASYIRLGETAEKLDALYAALEYYDKALDITKKLAEQLDTPESRRCASLCYKKLGQICEKLNDLSGAYDNCEKSLEIDEKLAEQLDTPGSHGDLAMSCYKLGSLCETLQDQPEAQEYYEKAVKIFERLAKLLGTPASQQDLSACYIALGGIHEKKGELSEAQNYCEKAIEINQKLAEQLDTPRTYETLFAGYIDIGNVYIAQKNIFEARNYYEMALETAKRLEKQLNTPETKNNLSLSYNRLGTTYEAEDELLKARIYYEKELESSEVYADLLDEPKVWRDLSERCIELGNLCKTIGELSEARKYYKKALETAERLGKSKSQTDLYLVGYNKIGSIYEAEGEHFEAQKYYERSLEAGNMLLDRSGTAQVWSVYSESCIGLGNIFREQGEFSKAREYYSKAGFIKKKIVERLPTEETYVDLAAVYSLLAEISEPDDRKIYLNNCEYIWNSLVQTFPDNLSYKSALEDVRRRSN